MDVPAWVEANLRLPDEAVGERNVFNLSPAFLKAMSEPGGRVRYLTPAELRRANGPSVCELLEMLRVIEAGGQVLIYEPTREGEA
ncbi:hypothetical protein [Methylorubrum populi]|uniref:hypothetical protein n=1 Tax=Methylorubrum populi TaxID=223967 RepID=UPI001151A924|nr:hypothetical protein [Methylorubrum populi]